MKIKCIFLCLMLVSLHSVSHAQLSKYLKLPKVLTLKKQTASKPAEQKPTEQKEAAQKPALVKVLDTNVSPKLSFKQTVLKYKQDLQKNLDKTFVNFTDNNMYLLAGMNVSKQNITVGDYQSNFNYDLSDYNKNAFKPGYYGGVRIDGKYKQKHNYSLELSLHKISTGTNYKDAGTLTPFLGSFSKFKADDQFFTLSIAAHYKKLIPFGNQSNHQLYVVAGPSIGTRLFGTSIDNEVTDAYKRIFFKGDIGLEWNNRKAYTFFLHYQHSLGSMTKSPIQNNLNAFELGVFTAAKEIF